MTKTVARPATEEEPRTRKQYGAHLAAMRAEEKAQFAAMTDADFEFIETVVVALRERYPAMQMMYGFYGQDEN